MFDTTSTNNIQKKKYIYYKINNNIEIKFNEKFVIKLDIKKSFYL